MGSRRKARESALQILFELEFNAQDPLQAVQRYWEGNKGSMEARKYSAWLVTGIQANRQEIDAVIQSHSENWRISRMAHVDRNILRIASFELLYGKNVSPAIVINEAIEIAKKYSGETAATFVNGILDAVRKAVSKGRRAAKEGVNEQARRNPK